MQNTVPKTNVSTRSVAEMTAALPYNIHRLTQQASRHSARLPPVKWHIDTMVCLHVQ